MCLQSIGPGRPSKAAGAGSVFFGKRTIFKRMILDAVGDGEFGLCFLFAHLFGLSWMNLDGFFAHLFGLSIF